MMRASILSLLLPLTLPTSMAAPHSATPDVIAALIGSWSGEGELFGQPATFAMTWAWELDGQFVRLTFDNGAIEAVAHYRVDGSDRLSGTWFDSRGEVVELRAVATDSTLTTRWIAETEQGRTIYRVVDEATVEVEDAVLTDDGWRPFGRATYRRVDA